MRCIIFLLFPLLLFAQENPEENHYNISFRLSYPLLGEPGDIDGIDWKREKLVTDIELKGDVPLKYQIELTSDSTMVLFRFNAGKFEVVDTQIYQPYFWMLDEGDYLLSWFKVKDFDYDGDEDLVCRLYTNVNGNEWTVVYINDQKREQLVKLRDTADDSDIWNNPKYNKDTAVIECELYGSAYGFSAVSRYKLNGVITVPLEKSETDATHPDYFITNEYIGKNGKWKLIKRKKIKAQ